MNDPLTAPDPASAPAPDRDPAQAPADASCVPAIEALQRLGIPFERVDHPAVYTTEEASRLVPPLPGAKAKNLFLRDAHGRQHFLVVVPYAKRADLSGLAKVLGLRKLTFGSPQDLQHLLGVTPGAVSVLGVVCDRACAVRVVIDEGLWQAQALQCHPLVNTATLSVPLPGLRQLLAATGHEAEVLDVPARAEPAGSAQG